MALFTVKKSRMPKTTIKELLALMQREKAQKPVFISVSEVGATKEQVKGAKIPEAPESAIKGANILSKRSEVECRICNRNLSR